MDIAHKKLYKQSKGGKLQEYHITLFEQDKKVYLKTSYGFSGMGFQSDTKTIESKNIGKANETTLQDQGLSEMLSLVKKQLDKGYTTDLEECNAESSTSDSKGRALPMLAEKDITKIKFPCRVQRKYDGMRSMSTRDIQRFFAYSRRGKDILTMDHILKDMPGNLQIGETLDGELYKPNKDFGDFISLVKKKQKGTDTVKYLVYDLIPKAGKENMTQLQREARLRVLKRYSGPSIVYAPTYWVNNEEELHELFRQFINEGYEGLIARDPNGTYSVGRRTNNLIKYKEMDENEFTICGYEEATGRDKGTIIFICSLPSGGTVSVRPRGTREVRRRAFLNGDAYIGKPLTVIYQGLSKDGIPRFPVGKVIRDYE